MKKLKFKEHLKALSLFCNVGIAETYFKEIGVSETAIRDLFVLQIGMFHRTKDEIVSVFDEYELESIIKSLNYDVNTVDLIEFS